MSERGTHDPRADEPAAAGSEGSRPQQASGAPPPARSAAAEPAPHRSRGWMAATAVLLLAVVALGVWALSLRSDNEDKDATIESQQQQLEQQEGVAGDLREAASGVAGDVQQALSGLGDQLDQIQGTAGATQADVQAAIDQAEAASADAKARADSAGDEVDRLRAQADEAAADADAAGACARGYLSAISGAFDAASLEEGVAQARSDIEALSGSCSGTLGS